MANINLPDPDFISNHIIDVEDCISPSFSISILVYNDDNIDVIGIAWVEVWGDILDIFHLITPNYNDDTSVRAYMGFSEETVFQISYISGYVVDIRWIYFYFGQEILPVRNWKTSIRLMDVVVRNTVNNVIPEGTISNADSIQGVVYLNHVSIHIIVVFSNRGVTNDGLEKIF